MTQLDLISVTEQARHLLATGRHTDACNLALRLNRQGRMHDARRVWILILAQPLPTEGK